MTILDTLKRVHGTLEDVKDNGSLDKVFEAKHILRDVISLLSKRYDIGTKIEPLIERYGSIDNVPDVVRF